METIKETDLQCTKGKYLGELRADSHFDISVSISINISIRKTCMNRDYISICISISISTRNGTFSIFLCLCLCFCCEYFSVNQAVHKHKRKHKSFLVSGIHKNTIQALSAENMATQINEKLAESVRNYSCLYGKKSADFKDKNKKALAWSDVANEVGLQNGK